MNTLWVIANIILFLVLIGLLFYMQKKHLSFSKRVFSALGLGIVLGLYIHLCIWNRFECN